MYVADSLTVKLLFALPYLLKDHKTKAAHEQLIVSSPVSNYIRIYNHVYLSSKIKAKFLLQQI